MVLTLVAIVTLATVAISQQASMVDGLRLLKDFKEVSSAAERLESSELLLVEQTDKKKTERNDLIYVFARIAKGDICEKQFEKVVKVADEYRHKAHNFVDENKGEQSWLTKLNIILGAPQGAGMRNLAYFDPYLNTITDRYIAQVKNKQITSADIDCDVSKFQIRNLHSILFVLQTDIKYMILEDQQILNRAIYEQLKSDRFISTSNFYELHELSARQRELLLNFYADRVNHEEKTVVEAFDHYNNPGEYIIGRVIDSCQTILKFERELNDLSIVFKDTCDKSSSSESTDNKLFTLQYKFDKFNNSFIFCHDFLDAL